MAGLVCVIRSGPPADARHRFTAACEAFGRRGSWKARALSAHDGRWLGASFELASQATQESPDLIRGPAALFCGVLYNEAALRAGSPAIAAAGSVDAILASLYQRHGDRFAEHLDGEFCAAVIDPEKDLILLASDTIGNFPLYWYASADGFVVCSDLGALLKAAPGARRLDLRAVGDYLTAGAVLADRTLVSGISLLPPGAVLRYDARSGEVATRTYTEIATFFHDKEHRRAAYLDAVEAQFKSAVTRALNSTRCVGLSLSGGLDSRAILSAAGEQCPTLRTYTLGVRGCADQVIARKLATLAGSQHLFFELNDSYLRDFLPNMARMVSLTDGMYLSHGLTEMLALQFLTNSGIEVLLRGHGGELAKAHLAWPLHTDRNIYQMQSVEELVGYLSARANYVTRGLSLSALLVPEAERLAGGGSRASYQEVLQGKGLSPPECCSYLYLRELNRHFTVPSLELFRTKVEVRLPFLDKHFLKVLLAAPPEWRDSTEIHQRLIGAGIPALLEVRNSNTGAAADAPVWRETLMEKYSTVLKRLNVRGYRHYHNFDRWMRTMLLQSVQSELLAPSARVQAFIRPDALRGIIQQMREGAADRSYLLQVLLILELWQRENGVDA